ncbi:MAG TPA: hypothetical protein VNZ26_05245, partial [Vicinamibacterales bacterium]|nr:hypothetical protein [Vicinamibacterales bacterium]
MLRPLYCVAALIILAAAASAVVVVAQRPSARDLHLRGDRFKPLSYDEMTEPQKAMIEHLLAGPRSGADGPF